MHKKRSCNKGANRKIHLRKINLVPLYHTHIIITYIHTHKNTYKIQQKKNTFRTNTSFESYIV